MRFVSVRDSITHFTRQGLNRLLPAFSAVSENSPKGNPGLVQVSQVPVGPFKGFLGQLPVDVLPVGQLGQLVAQLGQSFFCVVVVFWGQFQPPRLFCSQ